MLINRAIPLSTGKRLANTGCVDGWNDPAADGFSYIQETNEPLVKISSIDENILSMPAYHVADYQIELRETVAYMLSHARDLLPAGTQLVLLDGWRSYKTQNDLYQAELAVRAGDENLSSEIQKYVSMPVNADSLTPAPHTTGGAVDVALAVDGRLVDFGSGFDQMDQTSALTYFETNHTNAVARDNRRLLYYAMITVGFEPYEHEWWHYNFGNQMAVTSRYYRTSEKHSAIYGAVKQRQHL